MHIHITFLAVILGCVGATSLLVSGFIFVQEIGEVNRKLPESAQISYWGMYVDKATRIKQQYKRLYPNGHLHLLKFAFEITGFVCLFLALVTAGFFR